MAAADTVTPDEGQDGDGNAIALDRVALLRLLQLVSPALPIGTFAYSQALEAAVTAGWIADESTAREWIGGLLDETQAALDLPVLARLYAAWSGADHDAGDAGDSSADRPGAVLRWGRFLLASRASSELQTEERHLGGNLARLLDGLGVRQAHAWIASPDVTYGAMFALAARRWRIPLLTAAHGYAFAWVEAQTSAAVRLVPLGQSAGQRILLALGTRIPGVVSRALAVADDDIGAAAPSHAIASAHHETQYSRLFRS
jgi:urease accessory protein